MAQGGWRKNISEEKSLKEVLNNWR